jgi:hypothetical protein
MLAMVCGVVGWLGAAPALSAVTHDYLPAPSEKLTEGVPGEGPLKEVVPQPGPLLSVEAMTVDQGHLWLAEDVEGGVGAFRVDEFNSGSGAFEAQLPQTSAVHNVDAIAAGHATGGRELYVGAHEVSTPVVALFGASGALQTTWTGAATPGGSFQPGVTGVAVDGRGSSVGDWAAGDVYVATSAGFETGGGVVDVLEANVKNEEKYVAQIAGTCPVEGTTCTPAEVSPFVAPGHVAVSALTGEVFVLDAAHAVDVFRPVEVAGVKTFEYVRQFVAPAGVNLTHLIGVAVDGAEGDVYVASELGVLYEFTSEGEYLGRIGETPAGSLGSLRSVAVDEASHGLFVGEPGVVSVFGANLTIPSVAVASPTGLEPTSVTLNGVVDPENAGEATCRFEYGTSLSYGKEAGCTSPVANGNSAVPVQSEPVGGLEPDTVYHYRLDATNANGTNTGEDAEDLGEFLTPGPGVQASASDVSATAATLNASINPNGAATSYVFQYSTANTASCPASCTSVPSPAGELPAGASGVEVPAEHIQDLAPDSVYHFRVVAVSGGETFDSPDETFTTQSAGSFTLADGREWELVSPPDKHGALLLPINERGVMQAAADGDAMSYVADAPTESGPSGYAEGVQVFSVRGPGGWQSRDITLPHEAATRLSGGNGFEFRFFSEDLSQGVVQPFGALVPSVSPEASEQTAMLSSDYLNGNPGEPCLAAAGMHCFRPLVSGKPGFANVPEPGTVFGEEGECSGAEPELTLCGPHFLGATPDASHIVLSSTVGLDAQITGEGLYEWAAGKLAPVSLLPKGAGAAPHPGLGAFKSRTARGAISEDGSRVFWSPNSGEDHLYVRDVPREETVQLDVPQGVKALGAPNPEFQVASADGSTVFLTDTQHLTGMSGKVGADLYECAVTEEAMGVLKASLTDVTPGGDVQGQVLGISKDGSWVYFVANGVLAPGAVHGTCQQNASTAGEECNLYVRHAGVTQLVAVLSGADKPDWDYRREGPELQLLTARVSPDGRWLAFMSRQQLTGYDNRDVVSGEPDEEVFLYDALTGRLVCASCNPTGARPVGEEYEKVKSSNGGLVGGDRVWEDGDWLAANVPGWTPFELTVARYQSRYLSDSGRLFFNARDGLVPQAVNNSWDVYEFEPEGVPEGEHACSAGSGSGSDVFRPARGFVVEGRAGEEGAGCVALISSGESPQESAFLDASESGGDVFFLTTARLEPRLDYDSAIDVYDAHECTSASPCTQPPAEQSPACDTEASCKASPTPQPPLFGAPASATFSGPGNAPPSSPPPPAKPPVKPLTRAQKLAAALKSCRKDRVKPKRVACERVARKRYGTKAKGSSHHKKPTAGKGGN